MKRLILLALLASSCAQPPDDKSAHVRQFDFDPQLCTALQPETGGPAAASAAKPVTGDYFGKRYNRSMLESVLAASDVATQNFISSQKIQLYKIPFSGDENTCLFQHALPAAPAGRQADWDEESAKIQGQGFLEGLYVTYNSGAQVIMVKEDAGRWTLVHEMMHANYYRQRVLDGVTSVGELKDQIQQLSDQRDASLANGDYETTWKLSDQLARATYLALVSGPLEEIANESQLIEEWSAGRLKYVTDQEVSSAAWYIKQQRESSISELTVIEDNLRALALKDPSVASNVDTTLAFIESINQETLRILALADSRVSSITNLSSEDGPIGGAVIHSTSNVQLPVYVSALQNTAPLVAARRSEREFSLKLHQGDNRD